MSRQVRGATMHILHAYKVCHTEIYGGIPEVIRMLANSRQRGVTSGVLAARMRGWGRHLASGTSPIAIIRIFVRPRAAARARPNLRCGSEMS